MYKMYKSGVNSKPQEPDLWLPRIPRPSRAQATLPFLTVDMLAFARLHTLKKEMAGAGHPPPWIAMEMHERRCWLGLPWLNTMIRLPYIQGYVLAYKGYLNTRCWLWSNMTRLPYCRAYHGPTPQHKAIPKLQDDCSVLSSDDLPVSPCRPAITIIVPKFSWEPTITISEMKHTLLTLRETNTTNW